MQDIHPLSQQIALKELAPSFYANVDDEKCRDNAQMKEKLSISRTSKNMLKMINGLHAVVLNEGKEDSGLLAKIHELCHCVFSCQTQHFVARKTDFHLELHFTCIGTHFT